MGHSNMLFTALGPIAGFSLFWILTAQDQPAAIAITAAITLWTGLWWVFEPIPIPATSLLPLALFPAFSILTPTQVGAAYGSPLVLLLMGGFILSTAMERSGAHRRVALTMVNLLGAAAVDAWCLASWPHQRSCPCGSLILQQP